MAITFYSTARDGFRCRCDYNVSSTSLKTTISGTIYLQHKGAKETLIFGEKAGIDCELFKPTWSTVETAEVTSVAKHTDWTNVKSKAFSFSFNREHKAQTAYIFIGSGSLPDEGGVTKSVTIPVKPSYAIKYYANGGGNVPSADTKWYNETAYIGIAGVRSGYVFKSYNTKADGTGTTYTPNQSYTTNAALNLYAQWHAIPVISSLTVVRCDDQGVENPNGTCALVTCVWSIASDTATVTGKITPQTGSAVAFVFREGSTGTSGTAIALISENNGCAIDVDTQYIVEITATNNAYSRAKTSLNEILTRAYFVMDFKAGGLGVGIGRAAPTNGLEIGYETFFDENVTMYENLKLQGHSSPIGTLKDAYLSSAKSVASETATALCSISLEAGVWLILCGVRFPSNATGCRRANLVITSGATDIHVQTPAVSGSFTQLFFARIHVPTETTTYYLNAYHNAGTALSMPASGVHYGSFIRAIRIV